jgi:type IV pilus assembly protein PilQ
MRLFLLLFALTALAIGAEPPKTIEPEANIQITAQGPKQGLETTVTLDADDAFLPKILSILGEISGYNIVAGPEVNNRQRISIHIKETPVEQAVNLVVRAAGLSYEIVGNSFLVSNTENLEKEVGISSYLIELQFARAEEVKELLKDLTKNIQTAKGKNAIVISTSPKAISEIRRIIAQIDIPSKQIMLETRIIEVSLDRVRKLGIDWEKLSKLTTILVENPSDAAMSGINIGEGQVGQMTLDQMPTKQLYEKIDGLKNVGAMSRQLEAFDITLDYLMKHNSAKLITSTKLTTLNNRTASMHVGEIVPFTVQSQMTAQVERDSIGVKLEITPQLNSSDIITLSIKPEVSSIKALIDDRIPNKRIRTTETTVQVRDKQRIVIAGLTSEVERTEIYKLPFLGDLLFLGKLFQHENTTNEKMDLIIEITPYILNNQEDFAEMMPDSLLDIRSIEDKMREAHVKDSVVRAPTHLVLMPTSNVLKPFQYTIGIHEVAVGQFNGVQIFFSPWQNIGHQRIGVKFELSPSLALSVGYHWGITTGTEANFLHRRFGANIVKGFVQSSVVNWYGMASADIRFNPRFGEDPRLGLGTGFSLSLGESFAIMLESMNDMVLHSDGVTDDYFETWNSAAIRLRMPWEKKISIDFGITYSANTQNGADILDMNLWKAQDLTRRIYFDLAYSGIF